MGTPFIVDFDWVFELLDSWGIDEFLKGCLRICIFLRLAFFLGIILLTFNFVCELRASWGIRWFLLGYLLTRGVLWSRFFLLATINGLLITLNLYFVKGDAKCQNDHRHEDNDELSYCHPEEPIHARIAHGVVD